MDNFRVNIARVLSLICAVLVTVVLLRAVWAYCTNRYADGVFIFGPIEFTIAIYFWWFGLFGHRPIARTMQKNVLKWGGFGACLGFVGGLLFFYGNLGPIPAMFIGAPGGFIAGSILGLIRSLVQIKKSSEST